MNYWGSGMVRFWLPRGEFVWRRREGARAAVWFFGFCLGRMMVLWLGVFVLVFTLGCLCGGTEPEAAVTQNICNLDPNVI